MAALDMNALKSYVTGARRAVPVGTLLLDITHNLLQSRFVEISFAVTDSVNDVKARVYGMTGSAENHMRLLLNGRTEMRAEDNKMLGEYGAQTGDFIHVIDEVGLLPRLQSRMNILERSSKPSGMPLICFVLCFPSHRCFSLSQDPFSTARGGAMDDVTQVKKFELTEEEYGA
jgi:hypothetical protein